MVEAVVGLVGFWLLIVGVSLFVWILDIGNDDWDHDVTVDDLRELDKVLRN